MKRLGFISILLLAVLMMPMMVSCGGDEEKTEVVSDGELISKAIGTWMCVQSTDKQNGQSYDGLMVGKEVTINAGGTYTSTSQSFGYTGTYSVNGNTVTVKSNSGGTFVITVTFSGKRMVWDGAANNGVTFKYIFDRESEGNPQVLNFTEDLIAGDFSWKVTDFTIEKGQNRDIQKDKEISFKKDGSCTVFHSMEDAWRITNGRIETYYKKTNEPMFVYTLLSLKDSVITVRMNGTLDDELQATITLAKVEYQSMDPSITEDYLTDIIELRPSIYASCASFVGEQLRLEAIRTTPNTVHQISAQSSEISSIWQSAYSIINKINYVFAITEQSDLNLNQQVTEFLAEMRAIRAFIYYNLGMLWGNVPVLTDPIMTIEDASNPMPQSSQNEVYQLAYNDICNALNNLPESSNLDERKLYFCKDAGRMLKAELEMTLGDKHAAQNTLSQVNEELYTYQTRSVLQNMERPVIWAMALGNTGPYIPVYTFIHHQLYLYEITGSRDGLALESNVSIGDESSTSSPESIAAEWKKYSYADFGYWAALKRLGQAQSVTGCFDYELLMPIPYMDILSNPYLTQNPGY